MLIYLCIQQCQVLHIQVHEIIIKNMYLSEHTGFTVRVIVKISIAEVNANDMF